jgi:uncharacterized protein (DUF885 family)
MSAPRADAEAFDLLERSIVDHLFTLTPASAVALGLHAYDGRLPDISRAETDRWVTEADRLLAQLRAVPPDQLPAERRFDRLLLELTLDSPVFDLRELRDYDRNLVAFVGPLSIQSYLVRGYAPLAQRVGAMISLLEGVPRFTVTAWSRLESELSEPVVRLGIAMLEGVATQYGDAERVARNASPSLGERYHAARERAEQAIRDFVDRLRSERLPRATGAFALGPERFQRLLWVREGIRAPFSDLLSAGLADLARNQERLRAIVRAQQPPLGPKEMLERIGDHHASAEQLIERARSFVEGTKTFVREKDLVTVPEPADCRVEETPPSQRAYSTASMDAPGPFETGVDEGVYYVTPADPDWSPERQEQWLRSLNDATLRNTTVHEVYPGHYLQNLHFRRTAGSLARKTYFSTAFQEGWAHYVEQLAVEQGLDGGSAEVETAQIHDALLRDCRLVASVRMHTEGWTLAQGSQLFEREGFLEPIVAEREALRGTVNPEYFGYTLGKLTILEVRRKYLGPKFGGSLRAFHDRLLSFGCPPVGALDALLPGD